MPYQIHLENNGAYKQFSGHVTAEEFVNSAFEVQGDLRFDEFRYVINDFGAVSSHNVNHINVQMVAAYSKGALRTNAKIVIVVVTTDDEISLLAKKFSSPPLASYPLHIFPTLAEARLFVSQL